MAAPPAPRSAQVALDIEYHRNMLELHLRVSPKDVLIGWYSTGAGITDTDALIHVRAQLRAAARLFAAVFSERADVGALPVRACVRQDFYGRECVAPVHLAVDTGFVDEAHAVRAWVGSPVSLGDAVVGTAFTELPVEHKFADAERAGLTAMASAQSAAVGADGGAAAAPSPLPNDLAALEASVARLQAMLEVSHAYVDGVVEGRLKPNNAIGRFLADTVAAVPRMSRDSFDRLFNDSVQDVLLVMYLSNLTRTQLALAERLSTPSLV